MTTKQLSKLNTRIATLKASNRIVWLEGFGTAEVIKGKIAGKQAYFVRAASLNADGGCWYYIVQWNATGYACTCESRSYKQCQHIHSVSEFSYQSYQREFAKRIAVVKAEAIEKAADLREYKQMVRDAEEKASVEEEKSEANNIPSDVVKAHRFAELKKRYDCRNQTAEQVAAVEEEKAEAKLAKFKAGMEEQYSQDPRESVKEREARETSDSNMRMFYQPW